MLRRRSRASTPVVDALALIAFVLVGMRSHHEGTAAEIFVRNAGPLLICWFVAAKILGTYRRRGVRVLLRTWIAAVPVALLIRTWIVGSPNSAGRIATFIAVGLVFTLLFLIVGRVLARLLLKRQ